MQELTTAANLPHGSTFDFTVDGRLQIFLRSTWTRATRAITGSTSRVRIVDYLTRIITDADEFVWLTTRTKGILQDEYQIAMESKMERLYSVLCTLPLGLANLQHYSDYQEDPNICIRIKGLVTQVQVLIQTMSETWGWTIPTYQSLTPMDHVSMSTATTPSLIASASPMASAAASGIMGAVTALPGAVYPTYQEMMAKMQSIVSSASSANPTGAFSGGPTIVAVPSNVGQHNSRSTSVPGEPDDQNSVADADDTETE